VQAWWHLKVEGEQGDGDGEDGVGEGQHPVGLDRPAPHGPLLLPSLLSKLLTPRPLPSVPGAQLVPPSRDLLGHVRPSLGWVEESSRNTHMKAS
jgi:hypothetical protein